MAVSKWTWSLHGKCWYRVVGSAYAMVWESGAWLVTARGSGSVYAKGNAGAVGSAKSQASAAGRRLSARK